MLGQIAGRLPGRQIAHMRAERTLYEILPVDPRAEPEILEAAYCRLARKRHPDVSGSGTAEQRMKEINAACEVLRDPLGRSAYDRELLAQADDMDRDDEEDLEGDDRDPRAPAEGMLACRPLEGAAAGVCDDCGAGLCDRCLDRFQPPSCARCTLAWSRQRRVELRLPATWFLGIAGITAYLFAANLQGVMHTQPLVNAVLALIGCVVASYPSGWRVVRDVEADQGDDDQTCRTAKVGVVFRQLVRRRGASLRGPTA